MIERYTHSKDKLNRKAVELLGSQSKEEPSYDKIKLLIFFNPNLRLLYKNFSV
jgi:hypothetical protein